MGLEKLIPSSVSISHISAIALATLLYVFMSSSVQAYESLHKIDASLDPQRNQSVQTSPIHMAPAGTNPDSLYINRQQQEFDDARLPCTIISLSKESFGSENELNFVEAQFLCHDHPYPDSSKTKTAEVSINGGFVQVIYPDAETQRPKGYLLAPLPPNVDAGNNCLPHVIRLTARNGLLLQNEDGIKFAQIGFKCSNDPFSSGESGRYYTQQFYIEQEDDNGITQLIFFPPAFIGKGTPTDSQFRVYSDPNIDWNFYDLTPTTEIITLDYGELFDPLYQPFFLNVGPHWLSS